jgi:hypothetical protein
MRLKKKTKKPTSIGFIFVYFSHNHSLFDTKTNDINKMIKKILNNLAVKVSFYNSRYFNMYCKITSAKDKLAGCRFQASS